MEITGYASLGRERDCRGQEGPHPKDKKENRKHHTDLGSNPKYQLEH
jgi:hypothetical protein